MTVRRRPSLTASVDFCGNGINAVSKLELVLRNGQVIALNELGSAAGFYLLPLL